MRILFISPWFPFPPDIGIKIRLYNLLRQLAKQHEITLLTFVREGDKVAAEGLQGICHSIKTVPWTNFNPTRLRAALGYFSPTPRSFVDTYSPVMANLVFESSRGEPFDVVIASTIDTAAYAHLASAKVRVLEEHNFMTGWMYDLYRSESQPVKRMRRWLTFWKYCRYETRLYAQFDLCTMVSELDAQSARAFIPTAPPIVVVPNCIDLNYYHSNEFIPEPQTLVFNGSLTYSANLDAMQYFLSDIWHLIKASVPSVNLKVTGRTNGVPLNSLRLDGSIQLTGYLDDIRPTVGESWACVVPLREGGGTRLKVLEAMALGVPVISTSKGAEGLQVTHEVDIMIADNPGDFAKYTLAVLNDTQLRNRLAGNARCLVERTYDWEVSGAKFEKLLREAEARRGV